MNQDPFDFTAQPKVMKAKAKFREQEPKGKEELSELYDFTIFSLFSNETFKTP